MEKGCVRDAAKRALGFARLVDSVMSPASHASCKRGAYTHSHSHSHSLTHTHTHTHTNAHVCIHICKAPTADGPCVARLPPSTPSIHLYTYLYIYMYVCTYTYICMYVCICIYNVFYAQGARARPRDHQERALHARSGSIHTLTLTHTHVYIYIYIVS